jgi:hypothetical protein
MIERRVLIRFRMEVEVDVAANWTEAHTMKQIEQQASRAAEHTLRDALAAKETVRVVGPLGYQFTLVTGATT